MVCRPTVLRKSRVSSWRLGPNDQYLHPGGDLAAIRDYFSMPKKAVDSFPGQPAVYHEPATRQFGSCRTASVVQPAGSENRSCSGSQPQTRSAANRVGRSSNCRGQLETRAALSS